MGGLPHGLPPGMLKAPPSEMHREDMKGPLGQLADDRLVSSYQRMNSSSTNINP